MRAARNLLVREEELPLAFEYLDELYDEWRLTGRSILDLGRESDSKAEHEVRAENFTGVPAWYRYEYEESDRDFSDRLDLAFGLAEMLCFRLKVFLKRGMRYPIFAPPEIRRRLGLKQAATFELNESLIKNAWDEMVRVVASIQEGRLTTAKAFDLVPELSRKAFEGFRETGRSSRTRFIMSLISNPTERERFGLSLGQTKAQSSPGSALDGPERGAEPALASWREKWGELSNEVNAAFREAQAGNPRPLGDLLQKVDPADFDRMKSDAESALGSLGDALSDKMREGGLDLDSFGFAPEDLRSPAPRGTLPFPVFPPADVYAPCPCGSGKKYKFCCRDKSNAAEEAPPTTPTRSGRWTPPKEAPKFQPIEMVGTISANLQRLASDSREMFSIVLEATRKPHVLDDETVERMENVLEERTFYLGLYGRQLKKWRSKPLTGEQSDVITAADKNLAISQELTDRAREKVKEEIKPNTIDRVLSKSDLEIGVDAMRRLLARAGR